MNQNVTETATKMSNHITQLVEETGEKMAQQTVALDKALGDELTKSLEQLGRQLTSLSGQFVQDYRPLTEQLRRVVRIAEGLDDSSPPSSSGTSRNTRFER